MDYQNAFAELELLGEMFYADEETQEAQDPTKLCF